MEKIASKVSARSCLSSTECRSDGVFLIFGESGWIGGKLGMLLNANGRTVCFAKSRMENRTDVFEEIKRVGPRYVLNAAGVIGRPNVDWCEDHKTETIRSNVIGTLNLADVCYQLGVHCTVFSTGCIYSYDQAHPVGSGKGFVEEDRPNFTGSFYSLSKGMVEEMLRCYSNTLVLRVRMPISDDLSPRSFITKITKYEKVVNIPNSVTVLEDLLPVSIVLTERKVSGILNFTNPGVVSHNECLELYRKYIDPTFEYCNFTEQEQNLILKAKRSNNELDCSKLVATVPDIHIPHIKEALETVFVNMASKYNQDEKKIPGL
mmetsp:Transcript_17787/g.30308  ORF Transcript_17787/g.30308 Transcript_17787/m.30308 type:complete len:319 (-) Transcript_17787:1643-2599(-)